MIIVDMPDETHIHAENQPVQTREVLGLNIAVLQRRSAALFLERQIRRAVPVRLAFVNANLVNMSCENRQLQHSLREFLLLNDGAGVNIASRYLHGEPFPDNLNGTDFIPYFLDRCAVPLRVFLLGANPSIVDKAATALARRWPEHVVAGCHHGYIAVDDEGRIVNLVKSARPDIVLVAMGNGLQERWVERLVPDAALAACGVGALFDFLAGEIPRAPAWMRRLGIEWVFRLWHEPRRLWRRYLIGNPKFLMRVLDARNLPRRLERKR